MRVETCSYIRAKRQRMMCTIFFTTKQKDIAWKNMNMTEK